MNPLTSLKGFNSIIEGQFMHSFYVNDPFEIIELKDYYSYCEDDNHSSPYMRVNIDGKALISIIAYNELENTISNTYQTVVKKIKV
jgi:hypothetical protein